MGRVRPAGGGRRPGPRGARAQGHAGTGGSAPCRVRAAARPHGRRRPAGDHRSRGGGCGWAPASDLRIRTPFGTVLEGTARRSGPALARRDQTVRGPTDGGPRGWVLLFGGVTELQFVDGAGVGERPGAPRLGAPAPSPTPAVRRAVPHAVR